MSTPAGLQVAALYYVAGAERVHAVFVAADGQARSFPLLRSDEAFPLIDRLTDTLGGMHSTARKTAELERFASGWGARLLPPPETFAGVDVLVVLPQHLLHGVPLHLIRLPGGKMLGDACGISYCPSAALLRLCMSRNAARLADYLPPATCLSVAGDVLGDQTAAYREVVAAFAEFLDVRPSDGPLARPHLKECTDDVAVVVTHGHYDEVDPANCGLLIDRENAAVMLERRIMFSDGQYGLFRDMPFHYPPLFLEARSDALPELLNIEELKARSGCEAELVALLGCTTAAGSSAWIDDVGSLAEQFLRAGAASVVANIWESDIVVIREWCRHFLRQWISEGRPKALAWADANRAMASAGDASLLDWGTVTLWGDWL
jgi:CHAT domain